MASFRPALTETPQRMTKPHWGPPGQFRAAPLPLQCWIPPIRAPGQDFHPRSQRPCQAHDPRATRDGRRDDNRGMLSAGRSVNIQTNNHRREVGPDQAVTVGPTQVVVLTLGGQRAEERVTSFATSRDGTGVRGCTGRSYLARDTDSRTRPAFKEIRERRSPTRALLRRPERNPENRAAYHPTPATLWLTLAQGATPQPSTEPQVT